MPKISVIMPSLNVQKYIRECMESVMAQTLQDIEIVCVDAGSTDGTLEILRDYASKDSRIKIFCSEKQSYGYQVNMGIFAACGEYLAIVDTDDYIVSDMYEKLYLAAIETGADYVKGTAELFYTITENEKYWVSVLPFSENAYGNDGRVEVCPNKTPLLLTSDNYLWYGIYQREFFKSIRLHESPGAAFQDLGGLLQTQIHAEKAIYIPDSVYRYRQDNTEASIYNKKCFHFVEDEYAWAESFIIGQSLEWRTSFYRKEFLHLLDRMYMMAVSDEFWAEALPDIHKILKKLRCAYTDDILTEKELTQTQWQDLQLLWEGPHLLYKKYRDIYKHHENSLIYVFQHVNQKEQIVIMGSGRLGKFIHAQLLYRGYKNVVSCCDNNKELLGSFQYNIGIISPEHAVRKFPQAKYIIANKNYIIDMKKQLKAMGIQEEQIIVYSSGIDQRLFGKRKLCKTF